MVQSLVVFDVGNTATSIGVFSLPGKKRHPQPKAVWTIGTPKLKRPGALRAFLRMKFSSIGVSPRSVSGGMVSSVVPPIDRPLNATIRAFFGQPFPFVSHKTPSLISVRYRKPKEVGADRLVNARGAWALKKGASIVIDFGTATTFDCVSADGAYLGGVIAPGPVISAEALYHKTAKLPFVLLEKPATILGKNTLESIQSGLYHGYRGLVKEIVLRLRKRLGSRPAVFATGGQAKWILSGIVGIDHYIPHLTLLGLYYYWLDGQSRKQGDKK